MVSHRDGLREVVLERSFAGPTEDHFTFAFDIGKRPVAMSLQTTYYYLKRWPLENTLYIIG